MLGCSGRLANPVRVASIALAALIFASPMAIAGPVNPPSPVDPLAAACRSYNAAGAFAASLRYCTTAAEGYRNTQQGGASEHKTYRDVADMLSFAASDQLALGRYAEALANARAAHRILSYLASYADMDPPEPELIARLIAGLVQMERAAQSGLASPKRHVAPKTQRDGSARA